MKKASKKCTLHEGCCIEIFFVYSVVLSVGIEKTILCAKTYKQSVLLIVNFDLSMF